MHEYYMNPGAPKLPNSKLSAVYIVLRVSICAPNTLLGVGQLSNSGAAAYSWNTPRRIYSSGVVKSSSLWARAHGIYAQCYELSEMSFARGDTSNIARSLHLRKTRWNVTPEKDVALSFGFTLYQCLVAHLTRTHSF